MRSTHTHAHTHTLQWQRTLPHSDSECGLPSTQDRYDRWTIPGTVYGRGKTLALAARSGHANPKTLNPKLLRWQLDLDAGPYHGPGRPPYRESLSRSPVLAVDKTGLDLESRKHAIKDLVGP